MEQENQRKIYDGAGTLLAQTTYEYDNYRGGIAAKRAVQTWYTCQLLRYACQCLRFRLHDARQRGPQ